MIQATIDTKIIQKKTNGDLEVRLIMRGICFLLCAVFLLADSASAQSWRKEAVKLLDRTISGQHACVKLSDGSDCGTETWTITVQTDGTRSLRTHMNWTAAETQMNIFLRADENFRPIEGFANVYANGRLYGTGLFTVRDDTLMAAVSSHDEYFTDSMPLPENFSLLLHPIAADGWHFGYYDKKGPATQTGAIFTLGAAGRGVLVKKLDMPLTFLGMETITVPAGKFETEHYRFGNPDAAAEVWVTGPDRVMIKHEYPTNDSRWLLTEIEETSE